MSPYNYAANNPVNAVDKDGREPVSGTVAFIIGKALIGAGTDMATQITIYMNQGYSFKDALARVD